MKLIFLAGWALAAVAQIYPGAAAIDETIETAVVRHQMPGAVVQVGKPGEVLFRKAYGFRALTPARTPMTEDTIFDAASLTKVVATTSVVMRLYEQGKIRIEGLVTDYLPEFQGGQSPITVQQLMTHFSGLRPDVDLEPAWSGYDTGIHLALIDKPQNPAGQRFTYSDINFILIGEMVRRITGKPVSEVAREEIFRPLGMNDTSFLPPDDWRPRIAPTEQEKGMTAPLLGVVHDPTTRYMGGVAGHAGMFTTAADLGKFAEMMLNEGTYPGGRLFQAETIRRFTSSNSPPSSKVLRGLGWDIDAPYSALRGEFTGVDMGTGFTGTSLGSILLRRPGRGAARQQRSPNAPSADQPGSRAFRRSSR
ncbi:MAG: serine hydrolase domain-containing protein [Bryobacteraceae bacterium]